MKPETTSFLWAVNDDIKALRFKMDEYMYHGENALPAEDLRFCRKVYDALCKAQDLL